MIKRSVKNKNKILKKFHRIVPQLFGIFHTYYIPKAPHQEVARGASKKWKYRNSI